MEKETRRQRIALEVFLMIVVLGMTGLYWQMNQHGLVALNLFFLPVILSGYYLGRTSAGILALLCVLAVTIASTASTVHFTGYNSAVLIGLALTIWAAVLGLMALLMGTLCDERSRTVSELQRAYVGVVEVLSKYLQSANPRVKARSTRVAELSQQVAQELKLSRKQVDDIRVAALLHDLENVEITTQVMSRAVNILEANAGGARHTFLGTDLVHSLGNVLDGALPLIVSQDDALRECLDGGATRPELPLGAEIIATVRAYDSLVNGLASQAPMASEQAVRELLEGPREHRADVVSAVARVVQRQRELAEAPRS